MKSKKSIQLGINNFLIILFFLIFTNLIFLTNSTKSQEIPKIKFIEIKILDKVSSKNTLLKIEIGKEKKFKNLLIKV